MKYSICPIKTIRSWLILVVLLSSISTAQKQEVSEPIVNKDENPRLKHPITLIAKESNLSEVLKVLSERSGMNFVAGAGVHKEKVTMILNKTPLDEAIDILVRAAGLSYEIIGNSVLIAEPDKLKEEIGHSSYVVELKYADAKEVAKMLGDVSKNIRVDEGGNRLICYSSPRVIREIVRVVKAIDHPHVLVVLETRLIEITMNDIEKYGIDWAKLTPLQTIINYPEKQLKSKFKASEWVQMPLDFNATLDLLLENGDAKILMDSKLATTNNRKAELHIGEKIPYVIQNYGVGAGGAASLKVEKEKVGVIVNMTPHINERDQITITLEPEVSSITEWRGQNLDLPLVRVRKAITTLRVEDKQPIVIAGLLSEEKKKDIRKVPILGQLPILGMLFQSRRRENRRTNLIIEITPRIIHDMSEINYKKLMKRDSTINRIPNDTLSHDLKDGLKTRKTFREVIMGE